MLITLGIVCGVLVLYAVIGGIVGHIAISPVTEQREEYMTTAKGVEDWHVVVPLLPKKVQGQWIWPFQKMECASETVYWLGVPHGTTYYYRLHKSNK